LPASDVLSSRQIDDWLNNSAAAHTPGDADMGLADEQLPFEESGPRPAAPAPGAVPPAAAEAGGASP
jgi:segregation and condensation protein B